MTNLYSNISLHAVPTEPEHLVSKSYVDAAVNRKVKDAARVVCTSDIGAAYDSTAKTLTQNTPAALVIDGVTLTADDRVLLAGQTDATQNGVYTLTTAGDASTAAVLTRAGDFDESSDIPRNVLIPVSEGTQNGDTLWQLINDTAVTLDSSSLSFAKVSGGGGGGVQSFTTTITGDGSAASFDVSHGLNTENVTVSIRDAATKNSVLMGWTVTSANVVTIKPDAMLTSSDSFAVTVVG